MDKKNTTLGILLAVPVITIWGVTFVCTKALLKDFSSLEILFIRYTAAYLILWLFYPHRLKIREKSEEAYFILAGLTGVVIYQLMENIAIHYTNASNVSIIVSICPMFTAILSRIILKEKTLTPAFLIGFVISILGVSLVSFNGVMEFHLNPKGDILAMISGISWGFYSIFVSKMNRLCYNPIASIRRVFFYSVIFMLPLILTGALPDLLQDFNSGSGFLGKIKESSFYVNLSPEINRSRFSKPITWVNLLFLGFLASSFCFAAWNKSCQLLGTVRATIGLYLIPVVTILFAFIFLGEKISLMGAVGTVFTILGVVIAGLKKDRGQREGVRAAGLKKPAGKQDGGFEE